MENSNRFEFTAMIQTSFLPETSERGAVSANRSLCKYVEEMRAWEASYQNAVHRFQKCFIVAILIKRSCHLAWIIHERIASGVLLGARLPKAAAAA